MRCPNCSSLEVKVIDSRHRINACSRRRRYKCLDCGCRYSSLEYYYIEGLFEEQLEKLDRDTEELVFQKLDLVYHISDPKREPQQRKCAGCDGRGFVYVQDFINCRATPIKCTICKGTGIMEI